MSAKTSMHASGEGSDLSATHPASVLGYMALAALARALGKSNARAARDWCQRHHIRYRRDGKHNWVRLDDVRQVLEQLPSHHVAGSAGRASAAAAAVAALTGRK